MKALILAYTIALLLVGTSKITSAQNRLIQVKENEQKQESLIGQQILHAILLEMGLSLPKTLKKEPTPKTTPTPSPPATPSPQITQEDNFFDDNFFSDDIGFEDVVTAMDEEFESTVESWDEEFEKIVAKWTKAKKAFNRKKETYKKVVESYPQSDSILTGSVEELNLNPVKTLNSMKPGEFHTVPGSLSLPARNQADRGTCSAFASVRAMEIVLTQNNIFSDISEQHFYWTSKPHCQSRACQTPGEPEGVNTHNALSRSSKPNAPYIYLEESCPYRPMATSQNVTYAPLNECQKYGKPGIKPHSGGLKPISLKQLHKALLQNRPVVASLKLTRQWFEDYGFITHAEDENDPPSTNKHAGGHAVTFTGLIRLPQSYQHEGKYCAIVANSWGNGWGRGGHACLTERWLKENHNYFIAMESVLVTNKLLETYEVN